MEPEQFLHVEVLRVIGHLERELRDTRRRATMVLLALAVISGTVVPGTVASSNGNLSGWAYAGGIAGGVCFVLLLATMGPLPAPGLVTDPLALSREHEANGLRGLVTGDLGGRIAPTSRALHGRAQMLQGAVFALGVSTAAWLVAAGKL
jgi:hypothetical protein